MKNLDEVSEVSGQKNEMQEANSFGYGDGQQNHQKREPLLKTVFQCPVKCQGEKTYDVAGNCPVCNRHLEQGTEVQQHYYL